MKQLKQPFLKIARKIFTQGVSPQVFAQHLNLPSRIFPPRFLLVRDNFLCGGYFVCYNRNVSIEEIAKRCQERDWSFFASLVGNFLIIYYDSLTKELFVTTDQIGKFPCYFSVDDDELLISTDFSLIKANLKKPTLNLSVAFDYLVDLQIFQATDETTIISEIGQVPPGAVLQIKSNFSYHLSSFVKLKEFLKIKEPRYTSVKEFADDFLLLLKQLVAERVSRLGDASFAADLSTGLDSSLICYLLKKLSPRPLTCYTMVSQELIEDTPRQVIMEFIKKHNLKGKFIDVSDFYPFSKDDDFRWLANYPSDHLQSMNYNYLLKISEDDNLAIFRGDGGDEVYLSPLLNSSLLFPVQTEYFLDIPTVNQGLNKILTKKGIEFLLDKKRFQAKKSYPRLLSRSTAIRGLFYFPFYWETGLWSVTPFEDPRLVLFCRRMPKLASKRLYQQKREIWENHQDIFVASQLQPPAGFLGFHNFANLFLEKKLEFVISVLQNSIFDQRGWIKCSRIVKDLQAGNIQKYLEPGYANIGLRSLIRLEYFLQHNNIRVS